MEKISNSVLSVQGVTKIFGKNRAAVNNVSFEIKAGEVYGLIGQNGAGKTTIIRVITGLAKPTSGRVFICGHDIEKDFQKAIINVGGIIENPELYSYMSGMDNLKYFASLYGKVNKNEIDSIVALLGMENRINDKVKTYSGVYGTIVEIVQTDDGKVVTIETGNDKHKSYVSYDIRAVYAINEPEKPAETKTETKVEEKPVEPVEQKEEEKTEVVSEVVETKTEEETAPVEEKKTKKSKAKKQ